MLYRTLNRPTGRWRVGTRTAMTTSQGSELPEVESCWKNCLPLDRLKSVPSATKPPLMWWPAACEEVRAIEERS